MDDLTPPHWTYEEASEDDVFATVRLEELQELVDDSAFLNHLRTNGLDNWEWYDEALQTFKEQHSDGHPFFLVSDPK